MKSMTPEEWLFGDSDTKKCIICHRMKKNFEKNPEITENIVSFVIDDMCFYNDLCNSHKRKVDEWLEIRKRDRIDFE